MLPLAFEAQKLILFEEISAGKVREDETLLSVVGCHTYQLGCLVQFDNWN